jgi:nucleoside-diphosphate-sugar epimerase
MTGKRALVTGACGFVGTRVCERLVEEGYDVRGTDLRTADTSELGDEVEFVPANLTEREELREAVRDIDVIFHTASLFSYSTLVEREKFEEINVEGTENLCEAAVEEGVGSMVHWSTCGVYGAPRDDLVPADESHPKEPESNYDLSKWLQEKKAWEYHDETGEGFEIKVIRPAAVYGPGSAYGAGQVFTAIGNSLLRFYALHCDYRFSIVHVEDVVRAAVHVEKNGEAGEAYNVVDEAEYTARRLIKEVAGMMGKHVYGLPVGCETYKSLVNLRPVVSSLERIYDAVGTEPPLEADALYYLKGNYWMDNTKLKETGFEPKYPSFREGMPETIRWYEEQGLI